MSSHVTLDSKAFQSFALHPVTYNVESVRIAKTTLWHLIYNDTLIGNLQ